MPGRIRTKGPVSASANTIYWGTSPNSTPNVFVSGQFYTHSSKVMDDTTSKRPYPDNPMVIQARYVSKPVELNGVTDFPQVINFYFRYASYRPPALNDVSFGYIANPSHSFNPLDLYSKALANINPNKASWDPLLFLFEFKDFPGMLRGLGNVLSKKVGPGDVAGGYLAYRFGWAPLMSDLASLLQIAKLLEDREKLLSQLLKGPVRVHRTLTSGADNLGVSRFSIDLGTSTGGQSYRIPMESTEIETYRAWYSARLNSTWTIPPGSSLQLEAALAALGLNAPAATIWNAIPWSWLLDYFANIGEFIDAQGGVIPYTVSNLCIMTNVKRTISYKVIGPRRVGGVGCSSGSKSSEIKGRMIPLITTPILIPRLILTNGMMGILGALLTRDALKAL
jgi:hypothetical protein